MAFDNDSGISIKLAQDLFNRFCIGIYYGALILGYAIFIKAKIDRLQAIIFLCLLYPANCSLIIIAYPGSGAIIGGSDGDFIIIESVCIKIFIKEAEDIIFSNGAYRAAV